MYTGVCYTLYIKFLNSNERKQRCNVWPVIALLMKFVFYMNGNRQVFIISKYTFSIWLTAYWNILFREKCNIYDNRMMCDYHILKKHLQGFTTENLAKKELQ